MNGQTFLGEGGTGATFSEDRKYRYCLWRRWRQRFNYDGFGDDATKYPDNLDVVAFIGLNPSTADETEDDPTIRRCAGFAKAWGYGGIAMLNLFAFRATEPKDMMAATDPVGSLNDLAIGRVAGVCGTVVCAWGNHGDYRKRGGVTRINLSRYTNKDNVFHLGLTKSGQPKHPLYLRGDTERKNFGFLE